DQRSGTQELHVRLRQRAPRFAFTELYPIDEESKRAERGVRAESLGDLEGTLEGPDSDHERKALSDGPDDGPPKGHRGRGLRDDHRKKQPLEASETHVRQR